MSNFAFKGVLGLCFWGSSLLLQPFILKNVQCEGRFQYVFISNKENKVNLANFVFLSKVVCVIESLYFG